MGTGGSIKNPHPSTSSGQAFSQNQEKWGTQFSFVVVLSLLLPLVCQAKPHSARVDEHSNCLECHADHAKGTYVHAALKQGCIACHRIEQRDDVSYVSLKPAKTAICSECHASKEFLRAHFPYASGMCTRCHNPHASAQPRLLRASVNSLCLQCHLRTTNSGISQDMPTIALTVNNSMGHPYERHPVSGTVDPLTGSEMSCLSCHAAHGGTMLHHLKMGAEVPEDALNQNTETKDMCHKCHLRLWGLEGATTKKKKR